MSTNNTRIIWIEDIIALLVVVALFAAIFIGCGDNMTGGFGSPWFLHEHFPPRVNNSQEPGCPISVEPSPSPIPSPEPSASPEPTPEPTPVGEDSRSPGEIACEDAGKSWVCHFPRGNVDNYFNICISGEATEAHLSHGDTMGDCN